MLGSEVANTPMDYTTKLGTIRGSAPVDKGRYQRLMGKLIYLSHTKLTLLFQSAWLANSWRIQLRNIWKLCMYSKIFQNDSRKGILFHKNIEEKHWNFFRCRLGWLHNWLKINLMILHLYMGESGYLVKQETICCNSEQCRSKI